VRVVHSTVHVLVVTTLALLLVSQIVHVVHVFIVLVVLVVSDRPVVDITNAISSRPFWSCPHCHPAIFPSLQPSKSSAQHFRTVVTLFSVVINFATKIHRHKSGRHGGRCFGPDLDILLILSLRMAFFVRIIAICHPFAAQPRTHESVGCPPPSSSGLVLDANAAVKNDIDTPAPVLFNRELVLREWACPFVAGIRPVEWKVEAMRAVECWRACGRRLAILGSATI
jgi:hypothetical protein